MFFPLLATNASGALQNLLPHYVLQSQTVWGRMGMFRKRWEVSLWWYFWSRNMIFPAMTNHFTLKCSYRPIIANKYFLGVAETLFCCDGTSVFGQNDRWDARSKILLIALMEMADFCVYIHHCTAAFRVALSYVGGTLWD